MLIETCKGHQRAMGADLSAPRTHRHIYAHTHAMQIVSPRVYMSVSLRACPRVRPLPLSMPEEEHIIYKISQIIVSRLTISF